jgi:RND family efflux transporter MFP subunit
VRQGQQLFLVASGNVTEANIETQYREAKANFEKAKADHDRVQPLLADKIISQKDYLEIKNRYDQTRIQYETVSRNYTGGGLAVLSPMTGFIKQISVRSGEYVQLQAGVPLPYAAELPFIREANFRTLHNDHIYSTRHLNGSVVSYGKALDSNSSLLPIYFSLNNDGSLIPGQAVEVYLKSRPIENALVVPVSALIEEQGNFFVYVQVAGETFEKRAVTPGGQDGTSVQIIAGLKAGERVVTKGAYMVKLATQSGSVPAHGHEH